MAAPPQAVRHLCSGPRRSARAPEGDRSRASSRRCSPADPPGALEAACWGPAIPWWLAALGDVRPAVRSWGWKVYH
jgi:hypothetical protein